MPDLAGGRHIDLPLGGHGRQVTIQWRGERQEFSAVVLQQDPHRSEPMGAGRLAGAQLRHHAIEQFAADGILRTGHRRDVVPKPTG